MNDMYLCLKLITQARGKKHWFQKRWSQGGLKGFRCKREGDGETVVVKARRRRETGKGKKGHEMKWESRVET